jgi:hypothetical protein
LLCLFQSMQEQVIKLSMALQESFSCKS